MRLTIKIAAMTSALTTLIVIVVSLLSARKEVLIEEADIARDAHLIALSLAHVTSSIPGDPKPMLESLDFSSDGVDITWVPIAEAELETEPIVGPFVVVAEGVVPGRGRVVVSETLGPRMQIFTRLAVSAVVTVAAVLLLSLFSSGWMGRVLVGRRVEKLVGLTRRVAQEDYSQPVQLGGSDELTTLSMELNQMAAQLQSAREEAQRSADAKTRAELQLRHADRLRTVGQLAAGLAHELGTPLNVIAGRAQLLGRQLQVQGVQEQSTEIIREQSTRISTIVRRLMDYAHPQASGKRRFEARSLVNETLELLTPVLPSNVQIEMQAPDEIYMSASPSQLRQVLTNLVMNAAQAVTVEGLVRVTLRKVATGVSIAVEDDGPGIPPDNWLRVFQPFYTTKPPGRGTGLGLSIVEGIIIENGGSIVVSRSDLGGARFDVFFQSQEQAQ